MIFNFKYILQQVTRQWAEELFESKEDGPLPMCCPRKTEMPWFGGFDTPIGAVGATGGWKSGRAPLLPSDFDNRFHQHAPEINN
ncbi:hypothetical protein OSJ77_03195 [Phyllobacterium sp. 0TCS1.6C]|uniref:hypothetical protein n=1 Tax=unclassified Phyllobacterium TaxID=2638441 RepID=UPI0022640823|nr:MULTISPECIES: hypothetical protein [unclassified Phyllobacterium]MCX8279185.1 hypothetical protein [Phyllobacterium sp. 0TCS1.6C]MCX8293969.1 hypothetical protein [Phyllobacterium sp. 0TCS1.6A]